MNSSKSSGWPGYIQLATMALFTGLLVLLPTQMVLAQGVANECDAARTEVADNPLDYETDHLYDSLIQEQKDIIAHKKKGKLQIDNLSFNETFVGGCTRAPVQFFYETNDDLIGPLKSKDNKVIKANIYVIHKANNMNPDLVYVDGGDIYEGPGEQLHHMRLWSEGNSYKRAGTDTDSSGYTAQKYIKWSKKNDKDIYTVVLCIKEDGCLPPSPSIESSQQKSNANKKPASQKKLSSNKKPTTNQTSTTTKKVTQQRFDYNFQTDIRPETEGPQDWPQNASLKMIAGKCEINLLEGKLKDKLNKIYSEQCIELVNAPDWRLNKVTWKLTKTDQQILITGIIESTKKPEFTSLKVHVQIRGSQDFPTKQCALKYELFNLDDFSVGYASNKLIREKGGLLTASVSPNNIYWKNVVVKLSPLKKSDCNLENPSAIYYPPASENEPKFTVDATGVVTISPVYVYSKKPDITIAIMSYLGTGDAGRAMGSRAQYPMKLREMREAAQVFLQNAFSVYSEIAYKIHIVAPDKNGSLSTFGTEVAVDINFPKEKATEYINNFTFSGRDYNDTAITTLAQQVFTNDTNRGPRQIIVFGRSGKANDANYCTQLPDTKPDVSRGDSVAFVDFVSSLNKGFSNEEFKPVRINDSDGYPTGDCNGSSNLHWLMYPESKDPFSGGGIQQMIFKKFLGEARDRTQKYAGEKQ